MSITHRAGTLPEMRPYFDLFDYDYEHEHEQEQDDAQCIPVCFTV
jgi:nitrate reductase beta subunit